MVAASLLKSRRVALRQDEAGVAAGSGGDTEACLKIIRLEANYNGALTYMKKRNFLMLTAGVIASVQIISVGKGITNPQLIVAVNKRAEACFDGRLDFDITYTEKIAGRGVRLFYSPDSDLLSGDEVSNFCDYYTYARDATLKDLPSGSVVEDLPVMPSQEDFSVIDAAVQNEITAQLMGEGDWVSALQSAMFVPTVAEESRKFCASRSSNDYISLMCGFLPFYLAGEAAGQLSYILKKTGEKEENFSHEAINAVRGAYGASLISDYQK